MSARFRRVEDGTWGDERFDALGDLGKLLWMRFLTGPEVTNVPGLIVAGRGGLAEAMRWSTKKFDDAFAEVSAETEGHEYPMAIADWKARVIWLPRGIVRNKPSNVNSVKGWADNWALIPACELKRRAAKEIRAVLVTMGVTKDGPYVQPFDRFAGTVPETVSETVSHTVLPTVDESVSLTDPSTVSRARVTHAHARAHAAPAPGPAQDVSGSGEPSNGKGVQGEGPAPLPTGMRPHGTSTLAPWETGDVATRIPLDASLPDDWRDAAELAGCRDIAGEWERFKGDRVSRNILSWSWRAEWQKWFTRGRSMNHGGPGPAKPPLGPLPFKIGGPTGSAA